MLLRTEPSTHQTLLAAVGSRPFDAESWSRFAFLYGPHVLAWCDWVERRWAGIEAGDDAPTAEGLDHLPARDDLVARLEARYDRELFELAMRRVERRTWEAFRLLAIEGLRGKEVADRLGMQLGSTFAARHKVQRLIRETVQQLDPGGDN